MKKALFLYYSQAGQTARALEEFKRGWQKHGELDVAEIVPQESFPFPWRMAAFFRVFPRSVAGMAPKIEPLNVTWDDYDLVILGYQVWFLSPSLPIQGFLASSDAEHLKGKAVITVLTCRNLWHSATARVREKLKQIGAVHLGQMTVCELSPVWASFVTTPRWMLSGKKGAFAFFPPAGISDSEFAKIEMKGERLARTFQTGLAKLQGHADLGPNSAELSLWLMDQIGIRFFRLWTAIILTLTPRQGLAQDAMLILFRLNLIALIIFVAPCTRIFQVIASRNHKWSVRFERALT